MFEQDEKESSSGEAIPQAITSGLWLYNHHDLQVKKFLTHTLLYNLQNYITFIIFTLCSEIIFSDFNHSDHGDNEQCCSEFWNLYNQQLRQFIE